MKCTFQVKQYILRTTTLPQRLTVQGYRRVLSIHPDYTINSIVMTILVDPTDLDIVTLEIQAVNSGVNFEIPLQGSLIPGFAGILALTPPDAPAQPPLFVFVYRTNP